MANEISEVRQVLGSVVGEGTVEPIGDDDLLFQDRVIDSLHLVEIVDRFQRQFGIEVSGAELSPDNFGSIASMARFLADKRGGG